MAAHSSICTVIRAPGSTSGGMTSPWARRRAGRALLRPRRAAFEQRDRDRAGGGNGNFGRFPGAVAVLDREIERIGDSDPVRQQRIDAELITYALFSEEARGRGLERLASYAGRVPEGPAAQPILTAMAVGVALTGERAAESAELAERALREGGFRNGGLTGELWFISAWTLIFSDRPDLAESVAREKIEATRSEGRIREVFAVELTLACARYRQGALPVAVLGARAALAHSPPSPRRVLARGCPWLPAFPSRNGWKSQGFGSVAR
jgi:hypothetical protein